MCVFDRERGLADAAHARYRGAANRCLGNRRRLVASQQYRIEAVEFGLAAGEIGDARRRTYKWPGRPFQRLRLPLGGGDDAAPAFLGVVDADEILIDVAGEETERSHLLAAQNDQSTLLGAEQPVGLEAGEFLPGVGRTFVVVGEKHDEVARVFEGLVHRFDEIAAERKVIILYDDLITALD